MNLNWGTLHAGLQSVLDTALDAVIVMDTSGCVRGWNERATAIFGWSEDEARGRRLSELVIPEAFRESHELGLRRFLETGEAKVLDRHFEIAALRRDGREIPVELSITCTDQFHDRLFVGFVRDITERKETIERQQRLLRESEHRVKNMLTVVAAIARQTARNSEHLAAFQDAFFGRLESLAQAHQLLLGNETESVGLETLAAQVLGGDSKSGRASFAGPPVELGPQQVLGLSMILHELYTNAVKYGALCSEQGQIELRWEVSGGEARVSWAESGASCGPAPPSGGFGRRMMEMSARADLGGSIDLDFRPDGLAATISFPV